MLTDMEIPYVMPDDLDRKLAFEMALAKCIQDNDRDRVASLLADVRDTTPASNARDTMSKSTLDDIREYGLIDFRELRDLLDLSQLCSLNTDQDITILAAAVEWGHRTQYTRQLKIILKAMANETVIDDQQRRVVFSRGDSYGTHIHLPSNNGLAVLALLSMVDESAEYEARIDPSVFYDQFQATVTPGDPYLNCMDPHIWFENGVSVKASVIVLPCIGVSTIHQQKSRGKEYRYLRDSLLTNPKGRVSTECTFHFERTLDEAYFPGLDAAALQRRNEKQVLSRVLRDESDSDHRTPLLIVTQLWIWRVGSFIISCYPTIQESNLPKQSKERDASYEDGLFSLDVTRRIDHQVDQTIESHIDNFGKQTKIDAMIFQAPLDMFEQAIVSILSDVDEYVDQAKAGSTDDSYKKESTFLQNLSDIRAELAMVLSILAQQQEIVSVMLSEEYRRVRPVDPIVDDIPWPRQQEHQACCSIIKKAHSTLHKYQQRGKKLEKDAERIEKKVMDMLELKRTYATMRDARSSLLLGTAVIGFTVITIIFAPLSFLTSLFALKIDGFERFQVSDKEDVYSSKAMMGIFFGSEALTVLLTLLLVTISVWFIRRWDRIEVGGMRSKAPMSNNHFKMGNWAKARKLDRGDDLELQRMR
ncbi:uncharacterized protein E0L32_001239 [Thyridium curvatum]|uniref:Ankyrin repeat protein n=1 Tax=Thyridium curvatum TaxID=1093900 RepID=A0A507AKD1_9PEZI|nr:uncharacterized protein E0L32_001239 [Thyridium curvatum]TPX10042.1 hypothetical protein E0L32_001239 [Thyridium curvatum]